MDYKNEICNGCNQPIQDGDDIVVCPVCGTPQHRECWQKSSDCVNSHLHQEGFVWQKSAVDEPADKGIYADPAPATSTEAEKPDRPAVFIQLAQEAQNLESVFLREQVVNKEREFDGIKVEDAAYYLQSGAHRYIRRYLRQENKGSKLSWNWGAFFFAPAWFFYRKLYKFGIIFLIAVTTICLFSFSFAENIATQLNEAYNLVNSVLAESGNDSNLALEKLMQNSAFLEGYMSMLKDFGIYFLVTALIPNTVAALVADFLVKKKMKTDIGVIKEASSDIQYQRSVMISKGGVAPLIFAAVYLLNDYLVSILINIGTVISEFFK